MTSRYQRANTLPDVKSITIDNNGSNTPATDKLQRKLIYIGALTLDKRVTKVMLKWLLVDIKRNNSIKRSGHMIINDGLIKFVSLKDPSDVLLEHNVHCISSFTRCQNDRRCFFYLQRNSIDSPLVMFAYQCEHDDEVIDIFHATQNAVKCTSKPESYFISTAKQSLTKAYEVRFQGCCPVADKKKSGTFIDSWLQKRLAVDEVEGVNGRHRHASDSNSKPLLNNIRSLDKAERNRRLSEGDERELQSPASSEENLSPALDNGGFSDTSRHSSVASTAAASSDLLNEAEKRKQAANSPSDRPILLQFQDDKITAICLAKKEEVFLKKFVEISYVTQGSKHTDHFGFICADRKENRKEQYAFCIFQCTSEDVISEIMETFRKAFELVQKKKQETESCEFCPMSQYHKLCEELTRIKDSESQHNLIQRNIEKLPPSDYTDLLNKVKTEECRNFEEANDVLMTKLRIKCELKQLDHIHNEPSEFNMNPSKSTFDVLKNRARKALAFDMFHKTKSTDQRPKAPSVNPATAVNPDVFHSSTPSQSPMAYTAFTFEALPEKSPLNRTRSQTLGDIHEVHQRLSASADEKHFILQKLSSVGHSIEEVLRGEKNSSPDRARKQSTPVGNDYQSELPVELSAHHYERRTLRRESSWRRSIFESVVTTPNRVGTSKWPASVYVKRSLGKDEIRSFWKSAIEQTILLNRMERENKHLQENQEKIKKKRSKLDYDEVGACHEELKKKWKSLLHKVTSEKENSSAQELWDLVVQGVPRSRRGEVWKLLAKQYKNGSRGLHEKAEERPEKAVHYKELLHGLTPHQHSILIDIGRTFPTHPYFQRQLGAGQLALFNILKAYSLVDAHVGYCQGLGFVAGILLMHLEEEDGFELLCHMMYDVGLRRLYTPDMVGLQLAMYQLARLLRDLHPDVYSHLEELEITPALYAAPWFITLFSSTFPVGFVARVYDYVLMEGSVAVFKIAMSILFTFKDRILSSSSFEIVSDVLKKEIPGMTESTLEHVFSKLPSADIANNLYTYEIEYQVIKDDLVSNKDAVDAFSLSKLECSVMQLREQKQQLMDKMQIQALKIHNQESKIDALQQSNLKLGKQVQLLESQQEKHLLLIEKMKEFVPHDLLEQIYVTSESENKLSGQQGVQRKLSEQNILQHRPPENTSHYKHLPQTT